ncbi:hypothetical protein ITJ64_13065 [Herbiconiux sp. VKM Ac-1786]|uniref:hypothetical protein n=1 Tax=Herbiconiux sp. VKM Ac-1786 TaxID=2783824 RepID=UPI00188C110A|nr:hypothetical protein [Herbiconiux sp. VKM Ac-1786]MBF4573450.1 hypothetical protein [Herbiconiux sp. VKM Ac-1786]
MTKKSAPRDLAVEAQQHAAVRATFVKNALTRLPLIGALVITINLFVQVRGDVGLAVAVAQNLTFGGLLVVVLLNLAVYIMVGIMAAAMPLVFDPDYNVWTRVIGTAVVVLLGAVLFNTASWLLLAALAVAFVVVGVVVRRRHHDDEEEFTEETVQDALRHSEPPVDSGLRTLWVEGRALLRAESPEPLPVTAVEAQAARKPHRRRKAAPAAGTAAATAAAVTPVNQASAPAPAENAAPPEPRDLADVAEEWNARAVEIRAPHAKSVTRLAFTGIIGFVALFGVAILTQPIRFAPLELVSIDGAEAKPGFILLQGSNGVFVPDPFGTAEFVTVAEVTSRELCDDTPQWWTVSVIEMLSPGEMSGPDCEVG